MIKKIISGGQSGADIASIDAAMANNFPYGEWIPKGRRTEDGPLSEKNGSSGLSVRKHINLL